MRHCMWNLSRSLWLILPSVGSSFLFFQRRHVCVYMQL
jgi:hypothetical protein